MLQLEPYLVQGAGQSFFWEAGDLATENGILFISGMVEARGSGPVAAVEGAVLDGFGDVLDGDTGAASRSAMVRATLRMRSWARALRPCCCMARSSRRSASVESSQKVRICWVDIWALAKMARLGAREEPLVRLAVLEEAGVLALAGGEDAGADLGGAFGGGAAAELFVLHGGDFDVDVDAVEQRAADLGDVALDHGRGAHAVAGLVVEVAAGAGVHGGGEHEAGGEAEATWRRGRW